MSGEVLLEVVSSLLELADHVVDLANVALQVVFLLLDALVPNLRQKSLDVRLGLAGIGEHLEVGSPILPSENVGLALHDPVLVMLELLLNDEASPIGLNHESSVVFDSALLSLEVGSSHEALDGGLDADKTATHASVPQACSETTEDTLYVDGKIVPGEL